MLAGHWVPQNVHEIDFAGLTRVPSRHAVVSDVHAVGVDHDDRYIDKENGGVNQHNYLAYDHGKFWAMWSDGPGVEDRVGQRVKFATSPDGMEWSVPRFLTPAPRGFDEDSEYYGVRTDKGFRYISRGFWQRDGELLALFRDNRMSGYLYRSFSSDLGRTWCRPVKTNFPDACSKLNGFRNEPPRRKRRGIGEGELILYHSVN